jgi:hypothetical protein
VSTLPLDWQYKNSAEFQQVIMTYVERGTTNGHFLQPTDENIAAVTEFIEALGGYANGKTATYAVQELSKQGKLQWEDRRRRTKSGELALTEQSSQLDVQSASTEQLRDLLKERTKKNAFDPHATQHTWQLPLLFVSEGGTLTKKQFVQSDQRAIRDWSSRRKAAGMDQQVRD